MKKALLLAPVVVAALAGLGGCAPAATGPLSPAAPALPLPQTVRLGQSDDGTAVTLNMGDTLEIALPGNPTTGYTWQPLVNPWPTLESLGEPRFRAEGAGLGAGGVVTLVYQALQPGQVGLTLLYRRPFSPPEPGAQEFDVTVTVR